MVCYQVAQHLEGERKMRDGEPQIYTSLATLRNGYMQTQWGRVQMFLVFNTIALPLVFGVVQTKQPELVRFVISVVGSCMHVVLLNATLRADNWIKYLDQQLVALERLDQEDPNGVRVLPFSNPDFGEIRHSWFASRRLFGVIGLAVATLWIEEAVRHSYLLFH
jgi:hypothetical protein